MRFLGRKVYLGVMVVLATALPHGLTAKRRQPLIDILDIAPQTLSRWRKFWRETFPQSRCWQAQKGCFIPPVAVAACKHNRQEPQTSSFWDHIK